MNGKRKLSVSNTVPDKAVAGILSGDFKLRKDVPIALAGEDDTQPYTL